MKYKLLIAIIIIASISGLVFAEDGTTASSIDGIKMSDSGYLNAFINELIKICTAGINRLKPYVLGLMASILMWDIITKWDIYWGKQDYSEFLPLLARATFFVLLVESWSTVLDLLFDFGNQIGVTASDAGKTGAVFANEAVTPSTIIEEGVANATAIWKFIFDPSGNLIVESVKAMEQVSSGQFWSWFGLGILVLLLFCFIAFSYMYTIAEFYVIGTIAVVLLPFGLFERTKAVIDKLLNFFFISVIKVALFVFLITIINPLINDMYKNFQDKMTDTGLVQPILLYAVISLGALAYLIFKVPAFAAALFNGAINSPPNIARGIKDTAMTVVQAVLAVKTVGASQAAAASSAKTAEIVGNIEKTVNSMDASMKANQSSRAVEQMEATSSGSSRNGNTSSESGNSSTSNNTSVPTETSKDSNSIETSRAKNAHQSTDKNDSGSTRSSEISSNTNVTESTYSNGGTSSSGSYDSTSYESLQENHNNNMRNLEDTSNGSSRDNQISRSTTTPQHLGQNAAANTDDIKTSESVSQQESSNRINQARKNASKDND
jgi:hypothetical protein